ncbi:asparagine synthase-related protein [Brachybacterium sp. FME24]|uniref:asparagine synthase-related protein n=1 Tax=Brachybacterium sp. FME24 TaxID=2742605 RepID=UPI001865DABE|nr:asparagine synthase-related protein [Brachybacterium sp. FME24]
MLNEKMYRRGFLCAPVGHSKERLDVLCAWNKLVLGEWEFFLHPETPIVTTAKVGGRLALAVGDLFVAHGGSSLEESLVRLRDGDRIPLEDLSGRFAVFLVEGEEVSVVHDPLGSQTVFYSAAGQIIGSHAALVADALSLKRSTQVQSFMAMPEQRAKSTRFLPGDLSIFEGVRLLLPNNEFAAKSGKTRRYWPSSPIVASKPEDAFQVWDEYFTNYANFLRPRHRVVAGLTGGIDSRSIIATLRSKDVPLRYETWDAMKEEERARIPAMVEHLGGNHRWIDRSERDDSETFQRTVDAAQHAAGFTRGRPVLPAQVERHAHPSDLFVYGHGSGVMRGSYSRIAKPWLPEDPLTLAYHLHAASSRKGASSAFRDFTVRAFRGYLARGNYASDLRGADIGDLLYLESRMANWAALQIAVHAVGVNAHAGLNSRRLFHSFWGIPGDYRYSKALNLDIMRHYDPVLADL